MTFDPVIFNNGKDLYDEFSKKYIRHDNGLFILAPSGAGKTHFCNRQEENHWIDGDELWMAAGAHPEIAWWKEPMEVIRRVDKRSDIITMEAMLQGFWIMGASNFWLKPSAIILPDWKVHKEWIRKRENTNYDGGVTSDQLEQSSEHREIIRKWNTKFKVPLFETVDEAVDSLVSKIKTSD